jgi:hypothetical protein
MPPRSLLLRAATALVLPTALLTWSGTATGEATASTGTAAEEAPASVSVRATRHQRIRLEVLPQVVQPGGRVAGADAARTAVTAALRPVRPGRRVQLQVREDHGPDLPASWRAVAVTRQDRWGRAQFATAASHGGEALTYRVKAMASGRTGPMKSAPVSTARWLRPTWTDEFSGSHLAPVWNHRGRDHAPTSRRSCAKGDPSAVSVGGGTVRLSVVAAPDPAPPGGGSGAATRVRAASRTVSTATSAPREPSRSATASPRRG